MEQLKLGILGMGTVASGLVNIINMNKAKISKVTNKELVVKKVLVKDINKKRNLNLSSEVYTTNPYEVINDGEIDIVVELIGGIEPAREYIKAALRNKKHVVTANKALISTYGVELEELAKENNTKIMYEASVAGGIPIINTMSQGLAGNEFQEIIGILNGTTNYILTQMTEKGMEYDQALKEAQALGFAEADPSSDVMGDDATFKLSILASIAFNQRFNKSSIVKEGITKISKEDINYAKELGYNIKLLATAQKTGHEIELRVHPSLVPAEHPLCTVKNEFNAIFLKGSAVGELMLYGKGAGSLPTGSAVIGDIISISKNNNFDNIVEGVNNEPLEVVNRGFKQYYIRFEVIDKPGVLANIASIFGKNDISLASVVQRQKSGANTAPVVFITHEIERKNIDAALEEIHNYEYVTSIASIIMVENL